MGNRNVSEITLLGRECIQNGCHNGSKRYGWEGDGGLPLYDDTKHIPP